MELTFEKLAMEHQEDVIHIFNYYVKETTSAFRENVVENAFFLNFLDNTKNYCSFVIKDKQCKVVGFCTLEPYESISTFCEAAEPMYFIHPNYTGRGFGSLILKRLELEAQKRNIKKLIVDISSENEDSIRFHQKNGFTQCGRLNDIGRKFGRHFSIILMEKDISSK